MTSPPEYRYTKLVSYFIALLVALYAISVWPALHGPFLFDDFPNLDGLQDITSVTNWKQIALFLTKSTDFPGRPLAMLSFVLQHQSWPNNPFPFKLVNFLLHAANALLLFAVLRLYGNKIAKVRISSALSGSAPALIAAVAASAWLIHPIQLSATLLVVQRMTLMSAFFVLFGLWIYAISLMHTQKSTLKRGLCMGVGIGFCSICAILCKENGVLLPLFAVVVDATLLKNVVKDLPRSLAIWRRVFLYPPIFLILAYLVWSTPSLHQAIVTRDFTIGERLLSESRVLWDYIWKIFLPRYADFGVYHDDFVVSRGWLTPWSTLPCALALVAVFSISVLRRNQYPLFAFGVLWFLAGHLIESTVIPLELYFEHRNYLPLVGPLFAIATAIGHTPPSRWKILLPFAGFWLCLCLLASSLYVQVWADEGKLAYFWATSHPNSARAQIKYSASLAQKNLLEPALAVLNTAQKKYEHNAGIALSKSFLQCALQQLKKEDVQRLANLLRYASYDKMGFVGLGPLRDMTQSRVCPNALNPDSWSQLTQALLANPQFSKNPESMGYLHYQRHLLDLNLNDLDSALNELESTNTIDPNPNIPRLQAQYLANAGRPEEAITKLRQADYSRLGIMRRLLVNDRAMNQEMIEEILLSEKIQSTSNAITP